MSSKPVAESPASVHRGPVAEPIPAGSCYVFKLVADSDSVLKEPRRSEPGGAQRVTPLTERL